jgi:hypothetical protein
MFDSVEKSILDLGKIMQIISEIWILIIFYGM